MKSKRSFNFTLALFISVGVITGCSQNTVTTPIPSSVVSSTPAQNNQTTNSSTSPVVNTPSSSTPALTAPVITNPSNQTSTVVTTPSVTPANPTTNNTDSSSTSASKEAMTSYYDDESTFKDSESLSNDSFGTKALGDMSNTAFATTLPSPTTSGSTATAKKDEVKATATTTITTNQAIRAENKAQIRADLKNSGAVTVNADGTLTVDSAKLKAQKDQIKIKLQESLKVFKENNSDLRRKNNVIRKSDVQEVDNGDGTKTKTVNIEFKNEKSQVVRDNVYSKTTSADGKVTGTEHSLSVTTPNYTKSTTRVTTVDTTTMIKTIVTNSTTTWKDGKKVIINEQRTIDSTGKGTGTGTMTVTTKEGKTTTYNLSSNISVSAQVSVTATDPVTDSIVTTTENADGTATQTVTEAGKTETSTVNLETAETATATV